MTQEERQEEWLVRIRDVQGAIATVSVFQISLGFTGSEDLCCLWREDLKTVSIVYIAMVPVYDDGGAAAGLVGLLTRWITPLAIVPTVTLVGISLFDVCGDMVASHWGVSIMTITLIIMFSYYLSNIAVPLTSGRRGCLSLATAGTKMLKCFPVLLALFLTWGLCGILTAYDVLPPGSAARTDTTRDLLQRTPWFYVPYPGQWGWPTVTAAGAVSMLGACVASIMESIADYHACARISGAPSPQSAPSTAGCSWRAWAALLAGLLGTGSGTTSCSQNIGVISITKVASRRVVQTSAIILIVSGLIGKFGAALVTIPEPVMAGVLVVMFAMITSIGLSPLQQVDLSSSRNLFILGFSIFFGLLLPKWLARNPESLLGTGWTAGDQVLRMFLQTPMMVGGVVGCVLNNTIPERTAEVMTLCWFICLGTPEERGLRSKLPPKEEEEERLQVLGDAAEWCYDLPWITPCIRKWVMSGWAVVMDALPPCVPDLPADAETPTASITKSREECMTYSGRLGLGNSEWLARWTAWRLASVTSQSENNLLPLIPTEVLLRLEYVLESCQRRCYHTLSQYPVKNMRLIFKCRLGLNFH
ncbi:hypothetical protein O3P69_019007 [Scylla paramamosain]|uniref:Solute carrier family 23 member 2 n=1 Tax=Scylla paramamosain TaxID=85552 RepID=A0AAW0SC84_SCYPA